ncbi:thioredoxin family protein [Pseudomonas gingeri]|nr:thioredoxin family protein [Pseudomonas gingeri]
MAGLRRVAGYTAVLAALVIAGGAGTSSRVSERIEQGLLRTVSTVTDYIVARVSAQSTVERPMPSLSGAVEWLNSEPLSRESLRGKVVLVDFWTYECINCLHVLPHVNQWAKKYAGDGLVVIGVHTPEYAEEKIPDNVRRQVKRLGIDYPVAIDSDYKIWHAFDNQYWPAHYLIDAKGQVRYSHFGEGAYAEQEAAIQVLLEEAKAAGSVGNPG